MKLKDLNKKVEDKLNLEQEIAEVFQGYAEYVSSLLYGETVSDLPDSFCNHVIGYKEEYTNHSLEEDGNYYVTYTFIDCYEDYDRTTSLVIHESWLELYLEGHTDILLDVIREKCKQEESVRRIREVADFKYMANILGFEVNLITKED